MRLITCRYLPGLLLYMCTAVAPAKAVDLLDPANCYDYVIIGPAQSNAFAALHPELRSCLVSMEEIGAAFSGATAQDKVRAFVLYAYQNWKIAPTYLLLAGASTQATINPFYSNVTLGPTFSDDGYFVSSPIPGQRKPIMHVGRIPGNIANAATKTAQYQSAPASAAWLQRVLMLVGDLRINEQTGDPPNSVYRTLNDQLRAQEFNTWPAGQVSTLYSQDYSVTTNDATTATRAAWNSGYGFVNALGNTRFPQWLVNMAEFNLPCLEGGTGSPTFTESLTGNGRTPVVFGASCATGWWWPPGCVRTIAGDLVTAYPDRGAVALVGPTHLMDIVEAYAMNRSFVRGLVKDGVRNIGRLLAIAKAEFLATQPGHEVFAQEYALLGDPALEIKLGPAPSMDSFLCGAEIEDSPFLQDRLVVKTGGITGDNVRVVNEGDGPPLAGERMLRVSLQDAAGAPDAVEWKLQDLAVPITENMILSYWVKVTAGPGGFARIGIDGNTSAGRIKSHVNIFDQNGVPLDAGQRHEDSGPWRFVYADLSPLAGATLLDLRVRYESPSSNESGGTTAFIDNIRVKQYQPVAYQELVNGSFEEDVDSDGTPDFWTDVDGAPQTLSALRSDAVHFDGAYSAVVRDVYANGGGARQVFTANVGVPSYIVGLWHYSADATTFRTIVRDLDSGAVLADGTTTSGPSWHFGSVDFYNPYYGVRPARFALDVKPLDPSRPIYVDAVEMSPFVVVSADDREGDREAKRERLISVEPNPGRSGQSVRIRFELAREGQVAIGIFDVAGRKLVETSPLALRAGTHAADVPLARSSSRQTLGMCFVRMRVNGRWLDHARKIAVLP